MSVDSFKATMEQVLSQTAELTVSKVSAKALVAACYCWLLQPSPCPLQPRAQAKPRAETVQGP